MKDLNIGDMIVKDSGDLGFDIYHNDGEKICFINKIGEVVLMKWLQQKNAGGQPEWAHSNADRIIKEKGL